MKWCCGVVSCCVVAAMAAGDVYEVNVGLQAVMNTISADDAASFLPAGIPGPDDTVVYIPHPSDTTFVVLATNINWGALILTNGVAANNKYIRMDTGTTNAIRVITHFRDTNPAWLPQRFSQNDNSILRLTEYHDLGLYRGGHHTGGNGSCAWEFYGDAKWTYHTAAINKTANGPVDACPAGRLDFSAATSVHLERNPRAVTLESEYIFARYAPNFGTVPFPDQATWVIGRSDGQLQTWTVGEGSHPVLLVWPCQQSGGIAKYGTGDVDMPGVDLCMRMDRDRLNMALSDDGKDGTYGTRGGVISLNSLTVDGEEAANAWRCNIFEHLVLNGQAGLDCDRPGNGRAVDAFSYNSLTFRLQYDYDASRPFTVGRIVSMPSAGETRFESLGAGYVAVEFGNRGRGALQYDKTNVATIVANTLNLASPSVYMTDRNAKGLATDSAANGLIELRGDFVNHSTNNVLFRMDSTTVRVIGGGTNALSWIEVAGEDVGEEDPGVANFAWRDLVLGQDSTNG
ncbi:MAG: hypothetical protein FWF84_05415, partial [Kiritimatiellaeota bacterium]|nr:hypothetical protein [Kiritimatiellota bacterium]